MKKTKQKVKKQKTSPVNERPVLRSSPSEARAFLLQQRVNTITNRDLFFKQNYALPATSVKAEEERLALDSQFKSSVAMDGLYDSLTNHAIDMGQFPITSFVGYGVLQQIAQNGMIRNCIKTVADDCTREWITIKGGDETPVDRIEKLQGLQDRKYHLQRLFNDAITKVGFMGGAFIFIRTNPTDEAGEVDLTLPLRVNSQSKEFGQDCPVQFIVIDPVNVSPSQYNSNDPLRSDYMKPSMWMVLGNKVHHSRLLTMYTNEPPTLLKPAYNFLGIPQAQILWDYVNHWNECRVSAQELVKKLSLLIYYTDMQDRMSSYGGVQELDDIMQVLRHYRDNNSVFVADKEFDQVDNVQTSVGGVQDIVRQAQEMIAAINRTPAVKLFGISPSGFNATGESDIRNYNDHIRSQQELFRTAIQTCLDIIQLTEFGEIDRSITFEFNELNLDNESSQAMNFNARVTALATLKDRNSISAEEMRQAVRNEDSSHLSFLGDEMPEPEDGDLMTDNESGDFMQALFGKKDKEDSTGEPKQEKSESIFE